ncbi:serine/threonine protein kinase [Clostridium sp.]|uniref:serine/threonine protein kinase n=1 Tax=Clostridium sp. TaxID=1506 RepID=UPI0026397F60|nr:serine/threonine protein kinase [Clostridium sp.]
MKNIIELQNCKLLGSGAEGTVYLSNEGYAIKCFRKIKAAKSEDEILQVTKDSRFFPKTIVRFSNVMVREYVSGKNLSEHLASKGLSYKLSCEIIDLLEDLKVLEFTRLNVRNAHIFIDEEDNLKVIDPRKPFSKIDPYPKDIINILVKASLYDKFLQDVLTYNHTLLPYWTDAYNQLFKRRKKRFSKYG